MERHQSASLPLWWRRHAVPDLQRRCEAQTMPGFRTMIDTKHGPRH